MIATTVILTIWLSASSVNRLANPVAGLRRQRTAVGIVCTPPDGESKLMSIAPEDTRRMGIAHQDILMPQRGISRMAGPVKATAFITPV